MPRNPAAKKNQHNNRHENGLVGPGKRVTKQKSNGHLNGSVKHALPDEPIPTALNTVVQSYAYSTSVSSPPSRSDAPPSLQKRPSETSSEGEEGKWEGTNGTTTAIQRQSSVTPYKSRSIQDLSVVHVASTILKSCPARDTVALLIVLLALPSLVLTIVQALFASLTLVPPGNVSPVSFLSLFDVFQGSSGSPSLGTMAVVDTICLGLWISLWGWAQSFALDLAQIQIAITLGNGNSNRNGSVNIFCFVIVLLLHCVRSQGVRRFFTSNLIPGSLASNSWFVEVMQYVPTEADFGSNSEAPSKIKSLFAIHILSQAFMAFVRRRVTSSQSGQHPRTVRRGDTDPYVGSTQNPETSNPDAMSPPRPASVDHSSLPTLRTQESKDKMLSAKKRRRQGHQVRSRQPFWAALASTKVHVLRDFEHGQGSRNGKAENSGLSHTQPQDIIWVTSVEPSAIQFEATISAACSRDHGQLQSRGTRPFFVRINGAKWHAVTLEMCDILETPSRWFGTISGLAPDCTYTCTFNHCESEEEFSAIMVKTPALQDSEAPVTIPLRGSLRPSSPTTTLKNSIQSADVRLSEAKVRLQRMKRTHKAAMFKVDKDVEGLNQRLNSGGDDNKQQQKLLQAKRSTQQNQDAIIAIEEELNNFQAIPADELVDYDEKKMAHDEQKSCLNTAQNVLDETKRLAQSKVADVKSELNTVSTRKEKTRKKQEQLSGQYTRITEANAHGLNEKERKAAEAAALDTDRSRRELELKNAINAMMSESREVQAKVMAQWREIEVLDRQAYSQQDMMLNHGPLTPEGNLPGTNPPQARTFTFGALPPSNLATSTLATDLQSSPFIAYANTLPSMRPRSNTNRSNGATSGFSADFDDADPIPPMPVVFDANGMTDRKSSGSSRGKNNGSPAGVIGDGMRSPPRMSNSPGLQNTGTW